MLIAVSSFGESLRRVLLTAPAEAVLSAYPPRISKSYIKYARMFLTPSAWRAYNLYT
jgi:transglutaminase-like putative cysteine protease